MTIAILSKASYRKGGKFTFFKGQIHQNMNVWASAAAFYVFQYQKQHECVLAKSVNF